MTLDWCPGIREACAHWRDAPMLQQTFEAMERNLEQNNDACIDCAKTIVEVVCRVVVESFHTPQTQLKPTQETPSLSDWLTAAIRALKLGDVRDEKFKKLVSSHHKLADALIDAHVGLAVDAEDGDAPTLRFQLPGGDELPINIEVSRLLYLLDRDAYVEALNAARGAAATAVEPVGQQGEPA